MGNRWALYVDIEGFGAKWNDTTMVAFRGINALMQGIFWIGDRYYREPPDRLFAHQFGDGFLVASDFHESRLDRALLIAVSLLRHLLSVAETAKCAISEGELADVQGCYPIETRNRQNDWNIQPGHGIMTISPVMGSALVNSVKLQKKAPRGPMLVVSEDDRTRVPPGIGVIPMDSGLLVLNWLQGDLPGLAELQIAAGFKQHDQAARIKQLHKYLDSNASLSDEWKANAKKYLLN